MKNSLLIVGAGLSLLVLATGAHAQTAAPSAGLSELYFSDNNFNGFNSAGATISNTLAGRANGGYLPGNGLGVGYDGTGDTLTTLFPASLTPGTAQSIFQDFQIGTTGLSVGTAQIGIHGAGISTAPVTVYASIFNLGATSTTLGSAIVSNIAIILNTTPSTVGDNDFLDFSGTFNLPTALTAGSTYVLAVAPATSAGSASPASYAIIDTIAPTRTNLAGSQLAATGTTFVSPDNSGSTAATPLIFAGINPIAFRLYGTGNAAPVVPEAGSFALLALGALPLGLLAVKRRRTA